MATPYAPAAASLTAPAPKSGATALDKMLSNRGTQVIVVGLAIVALIAIVAYVAYRIMASSLKEVALTGGSPPRADAEPERIRSDRLPGLENGSEYGYSTWLYVENFRPADSGRVVLRHDNVNITLGQSSNNLIFTMTDGNGPASPGTKVIGRTVHDYVPLNRWVHVVCVYRERSVSVFVDGEISSVHRFESDRVPADPSGDLILGGGGSGGGDFSSWPGYVGATVMVNYYPSLEVVKALYGRGPSGGGGVLGWIGGGYGLRSPVYRM